MDRALKEPGVMSSGELPPDTESKRFDGRLEAPTLVALAANALRKKILAGELAPGQRLLEERLTDELAISRPPLREALRILEGEGLVSTRPRRGS